MSKAEVQVDDRSNKVFVYKWLGTTLRLVGQLASTVFGPSGAGHAIGLVPDPGASAGTTKFLREDGTWQTVSVGSSSAVSAGTHMLSQVDEPDPWMVMGPQGQPGGTGGTGATGAVGPAGRMGIDGVDGEDGLIGPPGVSGAAGSTGSTGPQGPQGPIGLSGVDGDNGEDAWLPGPPGPAGATGSTGSPGATGLTGFGAPGVDAEEADQPWLIQGPQGQIGLDGARGVPGLDGEDGVDGYAIVGPVGPPGPTIPITGDEEISVTLQTGVVVQITLNTLAQKFRLLLQNYVETLGVLPPGLEDDYVKSHDEAVTN